MRYFCTALGKADYNSYGIKKNVKKITLLVHFFADSVDDDYELSSKNLLPQLHFENAGSCNQCMETNRRKYFHSPPFPVFCTII